MDAPKFQTGQTVLVSNARLDTYGQVGVIVECLESGRYRVEIGDTWGVYYANELDIDAGQGE